MNNKNILIFIALSIFLTSLVSSTVIYGGENFSFKTDFTDPVFVVTGNSSNLEGMNVTFNGTHINISLAVNYKPDNFTLIFFDKEIKEITKKVKVGGGGGTKVIENKTTEYIEVEKVVEKEVEKEPEKPEPEIIKEIPLWYHFISLILVGIITFLLIYLYRVERG